ncbi:MAG: hypothetical protein IRZ33_08695 [Alicyclobacillaceae bacterium]|nr:hypothetical protein [Alicyclobacillaceae bacterium]
MNVIKHLFPPTIHPMVVHFSIAIVYIAALAGLAGLVSRHQAICVRSFFLLLCLGIVATAATGIAGIRGSMVYDHGLGVHAP